MYDQNITILTRATPSPKTQERIKPLLARGIKNVSIDIKESHNKLVEALKGIDIVISAVGPLDQYDQLPLATAAKEAGVKRFIPCGWITVTTPRGTMNLRDMVRAPCQLMNSASCLANDSYRKKM